MPIDSTCPMSLPATRTDEPAGKPTTIPKRTRTVTPPAPRRGHTITTKTTVSAAATSTAAPTRRVSRSS